MSSTPTPAPGNPTPPQIASVTQNLANMQALNDHIFLDSTTYFSRADSLLSFEDTDWGTEVGLNVMQGVIAAAGSPLGPAGALASTVASGLLAA